MRILAIHGSPRHGNSEILLKEAINHFNKEIYEVTVINPCDLKISGCNACDGCKDTGQCIIRDDMDIVYPLLRQTNRIIIASPIFFFNIPAQFKILIDRCQCLWYEKYVLKKNTTQTIKRKALIMLVGGMKRGEIGVTCAEATLKAFLRTIDVREHTTLSYLGYDKSGEILNNNQVKQDIKKAVEEFLKHG